MSQEAYSIDVATRHQIFVNRYASGRAADAVKRIQNLTKDISRELLSARSLGDAQRLQGKLNEIEALSAEALEALGNDVKTELREFGESELEFESQHLAAITTAEINPVSAEIVDQMFTRPMKLRTGNDIQELSINAAVAKFSHEKPKEIVRAIQAAVLNGQSTPEVVRSIRTMVGSRTARQARALVTTATNHMSYLSTQEIHRANSQIIDHERWVATLDGRTTIECSGLDGHEFRIGEGPQTPLHWNCRSRRVAMVRKELQVLGLRGDRASATGPVDARKTYSGWLREQPKEIQNSVLGQERAKLFRSGKLTLDRFTDDAQNVLSLAQLRAKYPEIFLMPQSSTVN